MRAVNLSTKLSKRISSVDNSVNPPIVGYYLVRVGKHHEIVHLWWHMTSKVFLWNNFIDWIDIIGDTRKIRYRREPIPDTWVVIGLINISGKIPLDLPQIAGIPAKTDRKSVV